ncbi:MAG TPA: NADH:flavin oxidoreductase/NADH oxidase [Bacteroidales bacterium]|jgi:2,4-dienoyl-CoA reductase-like NADH-dependent reductase (Old Yellow Enzyme family)|nr:oxidoreductase [Bacteroidales bacterium]HNR40634.1 NADH:flavin oxidoreductase/NADH oxidase [Bacteroidales bacterium]HPM18086.1 NADH:flavin oxidoreductase/NADH oxidase [Bacteroidales bacterium]HQG77270.1 NADH:flavin oxidoreductase/NADH oxidase [Bacteroidales bacterium]
MSKLFSTLAVKKIILRNRIVMSPMCQYSSSDGFANDWHLVHYGSRATGGAGLVIVEATAVSPEGRITPGDLGIWSDEYITGLERIAGFIHSKGAVAGIQLAHAGRKGSCAVPWKGGKQLGLDKGGWQTIAPSEIPYFPDDRIPRPLDTDDIGKLISAFRAAAKRARMAGFRVIEIHSAHGYLLHEFLSPLSNRRTDEYGGGFQNRIRFLTRVVEAVRSEWPAENPLFVRISATDWTEGGWSLEDSIQLASVLKGLDVDLIDCSSGGNIFDAVLPLEPGYQVPFSAEIRKTGILTGTVGLITQAGQAESILQEGKADVVLIGRELLRNPYFPFHAARSLGAEHEWPVQYLRAK